MQNESVEATGIGIDLGQLIHSKVRPTFVRERETWNRWCSGGTVFVIHQQMLEVFEPEDLSTFLEAKLSVRSVEGLRIDDNAAVDLVVER
jgi:hypothetical protein